MTMPLCTDCVTYDDSTEKLTIHGFEETGEYGYLIEFSIIADTMQTDQTPSYNWNIPTYEKVSKVLATRTY